MIKFPKIKKDTIKNSVKIFYNDVEETIEYKLLLNYDISILIVYLEIRFDVFTMTAYSFSGFCHKYS